jgi:hypothetical protein
LFSGSFFCVYNGWVKRLHSFLAPVRWALYPVRRLDDFMLGLMMRSSSVGPLQGSCKKRGVCCHHIVIAMPRLCRVFVPLRWVYQLWYFTLYNFSLKRWDVDSGAGEFSCHYLKNNLCSIYNSRPRICREYPFKTLSGRPQLLPGCGFSFSELEK